MCGIAGRLVPRGEDAREGWPELASRLQQALAHRGPDDRGAHLSADGQAGLVHTRLSILDLSPAGHQPMVTPDGRFSITFNGEIYNYRELRRALEGVGERFVSTGDTEVILRGYARHGRDFLRSLRGMFALCLWDDQEKTALLARDPLGIKPLYFHLAGGRLIFASELQALLATGAVPRKLSATALHDYFLFGSVSEPQTLIEGVQQVPAGHWLEWREGAIQAGSHWEFPTQHEAMTEAEAVARVRSALTESIAAHLVSDVPVGVFLSGGVDSTLLLAQVARQTHRVQTFSIGFDQAAYNETESARRSAQHFGAEHHELILNGREGRALMAAYEARGDQPSIDGFNTFCVSKLAHDQGAKVVLSGLGGDELFAGYPSFDRVPRFRRFARWAEVLPAALRRRFSRCCEGVQLAPKYRRLLALLAGPPDWSAAYWCQRGIFTPMEAGRLTTAYLGTRVAESAIYPRCDVPAAGWGSDRETVSRLELTRYMRNQLLRDSDVMSMGWSLELRTPLVDARFLEAVMTIPAKFRLAPKKQLLQSAFPELPPWVVNQPKRGFVFPFQTWMEQDWKDLLEQTDRQSPVRAITWSRRWALLALNQFVQRHQLDAAFLGR